MRRGRIEAKMRETRERRDATRAYLIGPIRGSRAPRRSQGIIRSKWGIYSSCSRLRSLHCRVEYHDIACGMSLPVTPAPRQPFHAYITRFVTDVSFVNSSLHGFGTRRVLLTIAAAKNPNIALTTCTSPLPPVEPHSVMVPNGSPSLPCIQPCFVQYVRTATSSSDVGMGRPSKYIDLPFASLGTEATVALNRARRARPQQMNPVRTTVSRYVRSPTTNASSAGATPKEIYGVKEHTY